MNSLLSIFLLAVLCQANEKHSDTDRIWLVVAIVTPCVIIGTIVCCCINRFIALRRVKDDQEKKVFEPKTKRRPSEMEKALGSSVELHGRRNEGATLETTKIPRSESKI